MNASRNCRPSARMARGRDIGETCLVHRGHQKVTGPAGNVTSEDASGAVRTVRGRRQRQHEHAGVRGRRIPGTGRPQYVSCRWAAFFSRATSAQYSRSRGQRVQVMISLPDFKERHGYISNRRRPALQGGRVRSRRDVVQVEARGQGVRLLVRVIGAAHERTGLRRGRIPARRRCASAPRIPPACSTAPWAGLPVRDGDTGRW